MKEEALRFDTSLLCEGPDAKNGPDLYSFSGLLNQSFSALTLHIQHSLRHPMMFHSWWRLIFYPRNYGLEKIYRTISGQLLK